MKSHFARGEFDVYKFICDILKVKILLVTIHIKYAETVLKLRWQQYIKNEEVSINAA